ncbi:hypothetical protein RD110_16470 [Rhodoferax koreense]|uniref:DUF4304 domain-containing protein n=1 Tax=Rhodoferax koreensis TaxID=1842727 RepID=A0A1P8JXV4_9BURK|nr:hypothetical protein [Rhodoferax koreense]APW38594.1 hypothetical protein RD110_16470 [Rhodoferax koreense]
MDRMERAIAKILRPKLVEHGFELSKKWDCFVRKRDYGEDSFVVVNQGTARGAGKFYEINCFAHVRHEKVELLWNTLGMVYGEDQLHTWTLLYKPREQNLPPMTVSPTSVEIDVQKVAGQLVELLDHSEKVFYPRFADLKEVEEWINKKPLADTNPTAGGPIEHLTMRALILAKLVNPPRYAVVREAFLALDKGMFPREKRMAMLQTVDGMSL